MKKVGIRELKNGLSEYLRLVRAGESVQITDRGEVVAELSPPYAETGDSPITAEILLLARRGLATVGARNHASLYRQLPRKTPGKRTSAELLDEERGDSR
jgi:antitoxin (DNA-binding transcriptional repressor) of toxin-antitoxin stability system